MEHPDGAPNLFEAIIIYSEHLKWRNFFFCVQLAVWNKYKSVWIANNGERLRDWSAGNEYND
jgi:hypothetical protein